jgi:hypothetical protein
MSVTGNVDDIFEQITQTNSLFLFHNRRTVLLHGDIKFYGQYSFICPLGLVGKDNTYISEFLVLVVEFDNHNVTPPS